MYDLHNLLGGNKKIGSTYNCGNKFILSLTIPATDERRYPSQANHHQKIFVLGS
jgi:hypothetical protein